MFFNGLTTVAEIKSEYRNLVWIHHPDRGGETETMQALNNEYQASLELCDGQVTRGSDEKDHTYHYNQDVEQAITDKIDELLRLKLPGIEIWLIGVWVWIDGDTRPAKEQLKTAGCRWHSKRKKWYWKVGNYRTRYNAKASFADIASVYGVTSFENKDDQISKHLQ